MFKGSIVALITPFKNDALDTNNYIKLFLIRFHLSFSLSRDNNLVNILDKLISVIFDENVLNELSPN